jgi:hypothetical protein
MKTDETVEERTNRIIKGNRRPNFPTGNYRVVGKLIEKGKEGEKVTTYKLIIGGVTAVFAEQIKLNQQQRNMWTKVYIEEQGGTDVR